MPNKGLFKELLTPSGTAQLLALRVDLEIHSFQTNDVDTFMGLRPIWRKLPGLHPPHRSPECPRPYQSALNSGSRSVQPATG